MIYKVFFWTELDHRAIEKVRNSLGTIVEEIDRKDGIVFSTKQKHIRDELLRLRMVFREEAKSANKSRA